MCMPFVVFSFPPLFSQHHLSNRYLSTILNTWLYSTPFHRISYRCAIFSTFISQSASSFNGPSFVHPTPSSLQSSISAPPLFSVTNPATCILRPQPPMLTTQSLVPSLSASDRISAKTSPSHTLSSPPPTPSPPPLPASLHRQPLPLILHCRCLWECGRRELGHFRSLAKN